ncbi:hypothetical protein PR048_006515 [Dryococelus australis]|uniref:Integrase catalytic domain-containing protein n=1 Tax=Dryococelus australis TaxID=614101 RepID=A0ABQ9IB63_9NEOP|nr:hypothetical protein PR048_006515 [Dryococelus australis]
MVQWLQHTLRLCVQISWAGHVKQCGLWILVLHHMTLYRELIDDFDGSLTGTMKLANGKCATAKGKGKLTLIMSEKCGVWTIQLSEVINVPELENNLMSVKYLDGKKLELRPSNHIKEGLKFTKKKIKALQSDNGCEYIGKEFVKHLRDKGILHMKTVSYSPQQNGKAETLNQTLMSMSRFMLFEAGLPERFWAEALSMANNIQNRCPSQAINEQIPFQLWFNKDLTVDDIKHIFIFGCQMWQPHCKMGNSLRELMNVYFLGFRKGSKATGSRD